MSAGGMANAQAAHARLGSGGILGPPRSSQGSERRCTDGCVSSPSGRKLIAHGASRGNEAYAEKPPEGAKDGAPAIFRPVPGLDEATVFPRLAPWAISFRSSGASWISTFLSHTAQAARHPIEMNPPLTLANL